MRLTDHWLGQGRPVTTSQPQIVTKSYQARFWRALWLASLCGLWLAPADLQAQILQRLDPPAVDLAADPAVGGVYRILEQWLHDADTAVSKADVIRALHPYTARPADARAATEPNGEARH